MATKAQASMTIVDLTDGYSIFLSQDSIAWSGNTTKLGTTKTVNVTVTAYQGSVAVPSYSIGTCVCSDTVNCSASVSGNVVTVTVNANATTGGTVDIPVQITSSSGTLTVHKTFSYNISLKGVAGDNALLLTIVPTTTVIRNSQGSATLVAHVFYGESECTVSSAGVVTLGSTTYGTVYWYDGDPDSAETGTPTAARSMTLTASDINNLVTYYAQIEQ